ncbi:similar to Saccharomyces cerevisiae YBL050W SEC17 Peripheral membrane protein required for vesicular transport between ER and Golgi, the 'priming' step in homotypic vacuole fusion, and autophagy [Maudiozyma barnettii]|uniref:Similar to Saccharomyces cerevisiae YBL050W SEC17 Peripheral membrane protein required for vesicular transport between ER and Golgi, the 'priming' step in homotypic vacuole fusion, and autophagy n=1 Tax=Maudiozyma barnettii TaxID=61262 RepID=A0A8H2VG35_9SACH|nr:similar to Saccharomyces cerevisiae YBL050W SEC17 Peripheral membrane protein required for vesicular transport between ER and Golgi, the 'priming' step in homotypic vacuole fusion, and autophagy [Kazachstania barnettii]CAB4254989.1 similar to Saccharomyces cerevisiae YBL050W SEC17 Peripheral membrane protein required for vesicular transport between ER and Golgi, the 'priming' step in homotypic vacuole fusion, and autophagy [Kazachstania barnettii]CAD1783260.1 similar to Saccharomyces cerevisia
MSDPIELLHRAEKKGVPSSGFMKIFGGSDSYKLEEAADLCIQAANLYKLRKELKLAGDAFVKAAVFQIKAGNDDEASNIYTDAYKSYKSSGDATEATDALVCAVDLFTKKGQFRRAANFKFELGEMYEQDLNDYKKAIDSFETAAEWYSQDQAIALANKCWVRCADLKAMDNQYIEASNVFAKLIKNSIGNRLSQWSLKEYFLKKGLCELAATDAVAAERTLKEGQHEDPNFVDSREAILLQNLIECTNENDAERLGQCVFDFDKFNKLDKWKTTILLKVKENITEAEDDLL